MFMIEPGNGKIFFFTYFGCSIIFIYFSEKDTPVVSNNMLNESIPNGHQNKKRKIGQEEGNDGLPQGNI